ncbi:MAG: hypothetical protein J6J42_03955 [Lachnospiraceae bacterium]|nr:hypothetical protein [Lachnospiraceae bacterium]
MKKRWKKEGTVAVIPILVLFVLLVVALFYIMTHKAKVIQIYDWLEDTVVVSGQAVCVPDRYIPGAYHWNRQDVVYDTGAMNKAVLYETDPAAATEHAAELAYKRFTELLDYNLPETAVQYQIETFILTNVISGTAYQYDFMKKQGEETSTMELESFLEIGVKVVLELPLFGSTTWKKETVVILVED